MTTFSPLIAVILSIVLFIDFETIVTIKVPEGKIHLGDVSMFPNQINKIKRTSKCIGIPMTRITLCEYQMGQLCVNEHILR